MKRVWLVVAVVLASLAVRALLFAAAPLKLGWNAIPT
jgi:hypothetical protein